MTFRSEEFNVIETLVLRLVDTEPAVSVCVTAEFDAEFCRIKFAKLDWLVVLHGDHTGVEVHNKAGGHRRQKISGERGNLGGG